MPVQSSPHCITGVLLAGGRARRMGGVDKGLIMVAGQSLAAWTLARLCPQVEAVCISANRCHEDYARFGFPIRADVIGGFSGPLAGLHAAMVQARPGWVVSVACDAPFFPTDLVRRLYQAAVKARAQVAVAATAERVQPVFLLVDTQLAVDIEAFLQAGGRKIDAWYERHRVVEVLFEDAAAFDNINTPEDVARASRRMPSG